MLKLIEWIPFEKNTDNVFMGLIKNLNSMALNFQIFIYLLEKTNS